MRLEAAQDCILNLLPTNLEWLASFFSLSVPSFKGASFRFHLGKLMNVQTNKGKKSCFILLTFISPKVGV